MLGVFGFLFALLPAATVELDIRVDGKNVGEARITQRLTPSGGKFSQMKLTLNSQGGTTTVVNEVEYGAEGRPVRKYMRKTGGGASEMITVTFRQRNANVVSERNSMRTTKQVQAPADADINARSELWFIKEKPKPGTAITYFRFDMGRLDWVASKVTYVRLDKPGHLVLSDEGKAYLDDGGDLLRLEIGRVLFTRKAP